MTIEENEKEIKECEKKIEQVTGKKTTVYRAPYGEYNDNVITAAERQSYKTIQWSLDTLDYSGLTGEQMWSRINGKLKSGDIILSHNGTKHTADSLEMLIDNIKKSGYEVVKVSDLTYNEGYTIDLNGVQKLQK